jgi:hypothetical protein
MTQRVGSTISAEALVRINPKHDNSIFTEMTHTQLLSVKYGRMKVRCSADKAPFSKNLRIGCLYKPRY